MFKVGDRVKIRKGSVYYGAHISENPADVDGVVTELNGGYIYVLWDTGWTNSYHECGLEYVKSLEELMEEYLCQS